MLWAKLAKTTTIGLSEFVRSGALRGRKRRVALSGYEKYRKALASGDVAHRRVQRTRADICSGCRRRTERYAPPLGTAHYCGEPFVGPNENAKGGCGCLVGVTFHGKRLVAPAGKTEVGSERCPHALW